MNKSTPINSNKVINVLEYNGLHSKSISFLWPDLYEQFEIVTGYSKFNFYYEYSGLNLVQENEKAFNDCKWCSMHLRPGTWYLFADIIEGKIRLQLHLATREDLIKFKLSR